MASFSDVTVFAKCENEQKHGKDVNKEGDYLVSCSKKLQTKEYIQTGMSKSWLLTAKTLYPHDVTIHFEAYKIEKIRKDVKEAAKCFSTLVKDFVSDGCVWQEIVAVTNSLRATELTEEQIFLKEMFYKLPSEIQHRLLWLRANQSDDTMEHCRFMLLLLTNFPSTTVPKHGDHHQPIDLREDVSSEALHYFLVKDVERYFIAAESSQYCQDPNTVSSDVCNLTPLLVNIDLPQKQILRLLMKAFEFYICYMTTDVVEIKDLPEDEKKIENPWRNLFYIYEKFTAKLGWELSNVFNNLWTKETAWQKITNFIHCHPEILTNESLCRQAVYGMNLLFLHSLHEYVEKIYEGNMILVEIPFDIYDKNSSVEPPSKRLKAKIEDDIILTAQNRQVPINTFVFAFKCWDLFHSAEPFEREFVRATQNLKIENWVNRFLQAVYLYKGLYKECLMNISYNEEVLKKNIHLITIYFWLKQYLPMLEGVSEVIQLLKSSQLNDNLTPAMNAANSGVQPPTTKFDEDMTGFPYQKTGIRHLQFLYLSKENILRYLTKLLIVALKKSAEAGGNDSANDGHILVLLQLNWPAERHIFDEIIGHIRSNRSFRYHLFMTYIVNMQMLEEFMFLSSDTSAGITLDIMIPTTNQLISQRRMSTRGVDKGAKEDFKMTMKKQTARESETDICALIMHFITAEKEHLMNSFVTANSCSV